MSERRRVGRLFERGDRPFAADVAGRLVLAQADEDRLPHDAVPGPLLELNLADEFRFDPLDRGVWLRLRAERTGWSDERVEQVAEVGPLGAAEPTARVADVDEVAALVDAQEQRPEIRPAATGRGEPADHRLLAG